jgi:cell division protein FtsZ
MLNIETGPDNVVKIKVIGVGGAGNNAVNRMVNAGLQGVEFIAVNTDKPALSKSNADVKVQIGEKLTKGQGAGANPEVGRKAAEESRNEIAKILEDTDMLFVAGGMGGGTGTGAAPIIADIAREAGVLTVGIVTKPFAFEGKRRMKQAEEGISNLLGKVDSLLIIPNDRLKDVTETRITLQNAFEIADDVLRQAVLSISEIVVTPALVNVDFADLTSIMKDSGFSHMGIGRKSGKSKAEEAVREAIASPLMETQINGASGILINFTGSSDLALDDVYDAAALVEEVAHPDANIIWGVAIDESMDDEIRVAIIATRFGDLPAQKAAEPRRPAINPDPPKTVAPPVVAPVTPAPRSYTQVPKTEGENEFVPNVKPEPAPAAPAPALPQDEQDPFDAIAKLFQSK